MTASRRHSRVYAVIREVAAQVSVVETDRTGRPGDLHRRQVLLVAESAGLAAVLHHLLDPADRLSRVGSLRQLAESRAPEVADVVVLDVPPEDRAAAVGQVRQRYLGPLVILVAGEDRPGGLRLDEASTLLARPFSAEELRAALAGPGLARPAPRKAAPAAPPGRPDLVDRVQRLLVALTQGWQGQRRVRVAGFSALALLAFTVAFAMAAQGPCGPGCDAFGTGFSPAAPTLAPASSAAPPTTGARRAATSTTAPAGSPATGAFAGTSGGRLATTATTERRATTTTRKPSSGGGGPGTTTPTTRPATTAPTTAPPTTQPATTATPTTGGA